MSPEENEAKTTRNRRRSYARAFRARFHKFLPLSPTNRRPRRLVITFTTSSKQFTWIKVIQWTEAIHTMQTISSSVVQEFDSAIHRINHCPVDKYQGNQLFYPLIVSLCTNANSSQRKPVSPRFCLRGGGGCTQATNCKLYTGYHYSWNQVINSQSYWSYFS